MATEQTQTTPRYVVVSGWWASHYVVDARTGKVVSHEYDLFSDAEETPMKEMRMTTETTIIALFESGLSPLEVGKKGYAAKDVMKAWRQWSEKAMAANKRQGRK